MFTRPVHPARRVPRMTAVRRRLSLFVAGAGVALFGLTAASRIRAGIPAGIAAAAPPRSETAVTSVRDVRACLPMPKSRVIGATRGGLYWTDDGGNARVWTVLDGLAGTQLHSVARVHNKGSEEIWVSGNGGVTRLTDQGGALQILGSFALPSARTVRQLGSQVYVGTWGAGLYHINLETLTPRPATATATATATAAPQRITSLWAHEGLLYVGTAGAGLMTWDGVEFETVAGIDSDAVVWSVGARARRLVVGTLEGAFERRVGSGEAGNSSWVPVSTADVRSVSESGLLATFGQGVLALRSGRTRTASGLPTEIRYAHGIAENTDGACVATPDGLWTRNASGWKKDALRPAPATDIAALARDGNDGSLWVGGFDRGLSIARVVNGDVVVEQVRDASLGERVNGIAIAKDGSAWVATPRGVVHVSSPRAGAIHTLHRVDRAHGLPHDDVHAVAMMRDGRVIVGTAKGAAIVTLDAGRKNVSVTPLSTDKSNPGLLERAVWSIAEDSAEDSDGSGVWLGTSHGLIHWSPEGVRRYSQVSGHLADDWVTSILDDGEGLWVGTYSRGVSRLLRTNSDHRELTATHWGGGYVNLQGLLRRGSRLYAATMTGLLWIDVEPGPRQSRQSGAPQAWRRAEAVGTGSDVTAVVSAGANHLWIASRSGLALAPLSE